MSSNFLFRKVSDKEKEEIQKEAKRIMDSFSSKLEKLNLKETKDSGIDRESFERKEKSVEKAEIDREIIFANAPSKNKDFLLAEKKHW